MAGVPAPIEQPSVAYRDGNYLIVDKPRGMPVHATRDPNRAHLEGWVTDQLAEDTPITLAHRIDVWTSGLVLFGISDAAKPALAALFATHPAEERAIQKQYCAICCGCPENERGELKHFLTKKRIDGIDRMVPVRSGGKVAIARYEVASYDPELDISVIRFDLETGRMHQLRVQAATEGWPMLGDDVYGDAERNGATSLQGHLLHAERLAFTDPIHSIPIDATAPPPAEFERHRPA